jgi:uncharacterized membrane protein YphA (DoxX/SURF4 family)
MNDGQDVREQVRTLQRTPGRWDAALLVMRMALGFVFIVAGLKLIIPGPFGLGAGRHELVTTFTDPVKGWMAPWIVDWITGRGVTISAALMVTGLVEVTLAVGLLVGLATPRLAMMTAMMLGMFTILAPTGGQVRISRDLALATVALALVALGAGHWSVDRVLAQRNSNLANRFADIAGLTRVARGGHRDKGLLVMRLGMVYTLGASALFTGGVFDNPMNTSLPQPVLFTLAVLLAAGLGSRYLMGGISAWLLIIASNSLVEFGPLIGAEHVKREIALCAAAAIYAAVGPDRWSLPHPHRRRCRDVSDLLLAYLEGDLPSKQRRAVEFHLSDCPDCWAFLASYRQTIALGKELRDDVIPAEVYGRLQDLVVARTLDPKSD